VVSVLRNRQPVVESHSSLCFSYRGRGARRGMCNARGGVGGAKQEPNSARDTRGGKLIARLRRQRMIHP
jgi:hypothetical protein